MLLELKNIPYFRGLQEDELRVLVEKAVLRNAPKNAIMIVEGEFKNSLYVILSGKVKIYRTAKGGKELVLDVRGPKEYFGEIALDEGPRLASVMTLEPCRFAVLSIASFKRILMEHPEIAMHLIKNLISMTRGLTENIWALASLDVYGRVSRLLLDLAVPENENLVIPEKPTQQEIAHRVGSSREVVNRILGYLSAGGYIKINRRTITINKPLPSRY